MRKYLFVLGLLVFTSLGCVKKVRKTPFYWKGYSQSVYNLKKNPGEESTEQHVKTLEKIIKEAKEEKDLQVPPGVYAEYGYYLMKQNKQEKARKFFKKEKQLYPESKKFVNYILKKTGKGE